MHINSDMSNKTQPVQGNQSKFQAHTAQLYFEKHQIASIIQAISTAIAFFQPEDPYKFMKESVDTIHKKRLANPKYVIEWDCLIKNPKESSPTPNVHSTAPLPAIQGAAVIASAKSKAKTPVVEFKSYPGLGGDLPAFPPSLPIKSHPSPLSNVLGPIKPAAGKRASQKPGEEPNVKLFSDKYIVFVLGGPGSGKGTQCAKLIEEFKFVHLSAGDLLRAEVAKGSERGKQIDALMRDGLIVPLDITLNLLKDAMIKSNTAGIPGFLIDGFPREMQQATEFERQIAPCDQVIFFDCPESLLETRLLKRGETSGRSDDNIESIKKRFKTFMEKSYPVVEYYECLDKTLRISSEPPVDEVYEKAKSYFQSLTFPKPAVTKTNVAIDDKVKIVILLGGPGSGKGTQCAKIVDDFGYLHLSTGDLLRAEVSAGSKIGKLADSIMKQGQMVPLVIPVEITLKLLKDKIIQSPGKSILVDGFPRSVEQAKAFEEEIRACNRVIYFECTEETLVKRLLKRGETSGNSKYKVTAEAQSRADDNLETIKNRIQTFYQVTLPLVDFYGEKLVKIEASTATADEIYEKTKEVVQAVEKTKE